MTADRGHVEVARTLDSIRVGARHRADLGDIDALATSIQAHGLLQPITVTPDGLLVCGARRLAALQRLGVRTVNVWVRSGISDELERLLAEQDDNSLHKPLNTIEAAALYREAVILLAEDAARRQQATRFTAGGKNPRSHGTDPGSAPSDADLWEHRGDTRVQAAQLVGGHSFNTLERVGKLQDIADDERVDDETRARAAQALAAIEAGATVKPEFQRVNAGMAIAEIEAIGADASQPTSTQDAALQAAAHLRTAEQASNAAELERLAQEALARVRSARTRKRGATPAPAVPTATTLPVKHFVYLWGDLDGWWNRYDADEIARDLTAEQWEQFTATLAGTVEFAERLRALRADDASTASAKLDVSA
ncbi:ParB N-terminal domain-containing protein [Agromyces seonyuensis]|uniref:ParB-like N-terminal domain-containing protein n=1 Tax=Agromyces seonyuensis TaxID=2662446 RepID=A0A6I4P0X2_9MICO|nr:hypothetical protein [Agromyces seonyuensis]